MASRSSCISVCSSRIGLPSYVVHTSRTTEKRIDMPLIASAAMASRTGAMSQLSNTRATMCAPPLGASSGSTSSAIERSAAMGMEPIIGCRPWSNWTLGGVSRNDRFIEPSANSSANRPSQLSMIVRVPNTAP